MITVHDRRGYVIEFHENPIHKYFVDGAEKISVTKVTKVPDKSEWLQGYAARITAEYIIKKLPDVLSGKVSFSPADAKNLYYKAKAEYKVQTQKAADIGTAIHKAIEVYLKTGQGPDDTDKMVTQGFRAFVNMSEELHMGRAVASEQICYSEYDYCCTVDIVAPVNGRLCILDIKTGKDFYEDQCLQLVANGNAWEESTGEKVEGAGIIRLSKEDGLPYWGEFDKLWGNFKQTRGIHMERFLALLEYVQKTMEVSGGK